MRRLALIVALLLLSGLGVGYAVAQDEPATPPTYLLDCASTPEAGAISSPDTLTDPTVEAAVAEEQELLETNATPGATPGQFACATPEATPAT